MTTELVRRSRTLTKLSVEGLLGRFDHELIFPSDWRFLILHGPNGVGKTRLLELLYGVFNRSNRSIARIPFEKARFEFSDDSWVEVSSGDATQQDPLMPTLIDSTAATDTIVWQASTPGHEPVSFASPPADLTADRGLLSRIEQQSPVEQVGFDTWIDLTTGEELGSHEIVERYGPSLETESGSGGIPDTLKKMLDEYEVQLIETQRLLAHDRSATKRRRHVRGGREQKATVVSYAEDLCQKLDAALAENSRTSQSLDRTFPSRLFERMATKETEGELRDRYARQLVLRSRLAKIAILDSSADLELPERELKEWERTVLQTYLDDADAKLQTFQPLLDSLELLREIVNERFLFKKLDFDRERGFRFVDEDSGIQVDLTQLSSGEQHEVVLLYDLLMKVSKDALVLIDEPEISLHVAWQKAFLDDLHRVASLRELRFIIATHSPQIIGGWWDHAVELYCSE